MKTIILECTKKQYSKFFEFLKYNFPFVRALGYSGGYYDIGICYETPKGFYKYDIYFKFKIKYK